MIAEDGTHAAKIQTYKADRLPSKNNPAYRGTSKEPAEPQYKLPQEFYSFDESNDQEPARYSHLNVLIFFPRHSTDLVLYGETFLVPEDRDLRMRLDKKYNLTRIPIPLYRYFIHGNHLTSNGRMMVDLELILDQEHGS